MKNFLVILKQRNDGCDYSIGCGVRLERVAAENTADALDKLREEWRSGGMQDGYLGTERWGESELSDAWIVPMTECLAIPLGGWAAQRAREIAADKRAEQLATDRADLERLRHKLGES